LEPKLDTWELALVPELRFELAIKLALAWPMESGSLKEESVVGFSKSGAFPETLLRDASRPKIAGWLRVSVEGCARGFAFSVDPFVDPEIETDKAEELLLFFSSGGVVVETEEKLLGFVCAGSSPGRPMIGVESDLCEDIGEVFVGAEGTKEVFLEEGVGGKVSVGGVRREEGATEGAGEGPEVVLLLGDSFVLFVSPLASGVCTNVGPLEDCLGLERGC
jgi:hypothetical protein